MNREHDLRKSSGFAPVYRNLSEHPLWLGEPFTRGQAWVDLLMLVNYKDSKIMIDGAMVEVKKGQHITSVAKLAERWGWSRTKVMSYFNLLKTEQMMDWESDNKKTVITLTNYGFWNSDISEMNTDQQIDGTVVDIKKTSEKHQKNIKKTSEKHQKDTNNKDNKDNKDKKENKRPIVHSQISLLTDRERQEEKEREKAEEKKKRVAAEKRKEKQQEKKEQEEKFSKFWEAYPRKEGRKVAAQRWEKIKPDDALFDQIMEAIERQKKTTWKDKEVKFIPHPSTWLNQERWTDQVSTSKPQASGKQLRHGDAVKQDSEYETKSSRELDELVRRMQRANTDKR